MRPGFNQPPPYGGQQSPLQKPTSDDLYARFAQPPNKPVDQIQADMTKKLFTSIYELSKVVVGYTPAGATQDVILHHLEAVLSLSLMAEKRGA